MIKFIKILIVLLLVGYCHLLYNNYVNNPSITNIIMLYILVLTTIWTIFFLLLKNAQYKNWFITSLLCMSMTCILNGFVVIVNGGFMPVKPDLLQKLYDNDMKPLFNYHTTNSKLLILGDYFPVGYAAVSIGDMFAAVGITILIILLIKVIIEEVVRRLNYAN